MSGVNQTSQGNRVANVPTLVLQCPYCGRGCTVPTGTGQLATCPKCEEAIPTDQAEARLVRIQLAGARWLNRKMRYRFNTLFWVLVGFLLLVCCLLLWIAVNQMNLTEHVTRPRMPF